MKNNRQTTIGQYFNKMQKDRIQQTTSIKKENQIQKVEVSKNDDNNQKQEKVIQLDISDSQSLFVQISNKSQKNQQKKVKQQSKNFNVLFYTNKISSIPDGDYIDNFHHKDKKWWRNYQLLQAHHGFIQWLFPNAFQSRFNRCAMPLNQQQIKQFQNNIEIAQRYQTSYVMMLQFYGLKLKCKKTGEITHCRQPMNNNKESVMNQKKDFWQDRYHNTFLTSFHNHMRITRILSSLVICGFGRYARQLSIFLGGQINKLGGGLQGLKKYGIYERQWKQYSEYVQKQIQTNILLKNYDKHNKK